MSPSHLRVNIFTFSSANQLVVDFINSYLFVVSNCTCSIRICIELFVYTVGWCIYINKCVFAVFTKLLKLYIKICSSSICMLECFYNMKIYIYIFRFCISCCCDCFCSLNQFCALCLILYLYQ